MASQQQYVQTEIKDNGVAIVTMRRDPVNSMNMDVWEQLLSTLTQLENNKSVRAAVFRSGLSRPVFTAGNDITELYARKTNKERYTRFWIVQNVFLARLLRSRLATAAVIKGACPAAGTGLSMCCDVRVATADVTMGLNEVALGISVPAYWVQLMARIIGQGRAEALCLSARMTPAKEGERIGLVDVVVDGDESEALARAVKMVEKLGSFPGQGRAITKESIRGAFASEWANEQRLKEEAELSWGMLSMKETLASLDQVMARLGGGKAKM
ncbi:hypothetical protein HK104_001586 [Borealophlyctis nickersoniae]|nr:hypothetical protein HK104_001586 [Borealophlyctis nickersoniae]